MNDTYREAAALFRPLSIRGVRFRNRIGLAPMSTYQSTDGNPTGWHLKHYADRSASLGSTLVEATALSMESRVTPYDLVLGAGSQLGGWKLLSAAIRDSGAIPGIQLCHAGRKASRSRPWEGDFPVGLSEGGWEPVGPTPEPFGDDQLIPRELSSEEVAQIPTEFASSAELSVEAGFRVVELHAGHGRLLHSFYSPISNTRTDGWGGSRDNRCRLLIETVRQARAAIGPDVVLGVRLSCTDWIHGGWTEDDSVYLAGVLGGYGCDFIDCTSSGIVRKVDVPRGPGYQTRFARSIKKHTGMTTAAVGELDVASGAEVLESESADFVFLGRELLIDPFCIARFFGQADLLPAPYQKGLRTVSNPLVAAGNPEL